MPSASIFTMSLGFSRPDPFARFVPGFYEAISVMDPAPAEVCVAVAECDASGVTTPPTDMQVPVRFVALTSRNPTDYITAAVNLAKSKWLVWCGLDDRMMPDALADIDAADACGADLIVAKCRTSEGAVIGHWSPDELAKGGLNRMASNSPFTRAAFERVGGWPDIIFHDWGLWLKFAAAGVKTMETQRVGMYYDLGHDHVTRSGVKMPWEERVHAMTQITDLVSTLWPRSF
jgi:hypothetical protein